MRKYEKLSLPSNVASHRVEAQQHRCCHAYVNIQHLLATDGEVYAIIRKCAWVVAAVRRQKHSDPGELSCRQTSPGRYLQRRFTQTVKGKGPQRVAGGT